MTARRVGCAIAAALLAGAYASMQHVSACSSPVWDETQFWGIGYYLWRAGRFDVPGALLHPPLSYYLNSLPLLSRNIRLDVFHPHLPDLFIADVGRGNQLLGQLGFDAFLASRTPFVVAYCLTGLVVFLWSRRWWGEGGGLFSLVLYLLCPTLMANGFLITTDALMAGLGLVALWGLVRSLERPSAAALATLVGGMALAPAAKATGLLLAPLAALCVLGRTCLAAPAVYLPGKGCRVVSRPRFLLYWAAVGGVCAAAAWATLVLLYQGDWRLETFRTALVKVRAYVQRGQAIYLDGRVSMHGFPTYYAKALLYKVPPATGLALATALVLPAAAARRRALVPLALAATILLYFSLSQYTLGLRFALLALPLLHVAAGRLAAPGQWARPRRALAAVLVLLVTLDVGAYYPYPRSYVDRLIVRGPGWTVLGDMDMDWGEGLVALGNYVTRRGLGPIALSYHGSANPALFGIRTSWQQNVFLRPPVTGIPPEHGLLFVSATNLAGVYLRGAPYRWLYDRTPVAVVGGTIYVYDLDAIPPDERWRR